MTMNATYTRDQAMEQLGIKSRNALKHIAKKHPESFILVKQGSSKFPRYDKDALDSLAKTRDSRKDQLQ